MKRLMEIHTQTSFNCSTCNKRCNISNELRTHKYERHQDSSAGPGATKTYRDNPCVLQDPGAVAKKIVNSVASCYA